MTPHIIPNLKNIAFGIILATIIAVNVLRFLDLENAPKGFYIDEITSVVNAHCIATEGKDYSGKKWPLFGYIGLGSPKPPTQMYPMALWIKIFGISIGSIRAFSACAYIFGLIGLFLLARLLGGSTCAWGTLLAASLSPWGWMFSRVAFESILGPVFLIWGVYFFLRNAKWLNMVLAGFFMACAMYSYPPTRLHAPLVILLLIWFQNKQNKFSLKSLGLFIVVMTFLCAPLVYDTLQGGVFVERFNGISIASKASSWGQLISLFSHNYLLHLSPKFLFLTGDNDYHCSTKHFGELSWVDMLGLGAGLVFLGILIKKRKAPSHFIIFLLLAAAAGIIPSALTWQDIPNALRSLGAQPFVELLVGYCLARAVERWPQILIVVSITGILFAACFLTVYFKTYPIESADDFGSDIRIEAEHCQTDQDWIKFLMHHVNDRVLFQYYIMRNYHKPYSSWFF